MEVGTGINLLVVLCAAVLVIFSGVPIAYGLGLLCIVLTYLMVGPETLPLLGTVSYGEATHPALLAIPLFLLTAEMLAAANMSDNMYEVLSRRLRRIPARLGVVSTLLSTMFSAVIGSSAGNTALMAKVAMRPMISRGYPPSLAAGVIVAGGAIGVLIPPSTLFILYGVVTETSVGKLMIAGLMPGLLMAVLMITFLVIYAKRTGFVERPDQKQVETSSQTEVVGTSLAQGHSHRSGTLIATSALPEVEAKREPGTWGGVARDIRHVAPIVVLIIFLSYAMYSGIATPTEIAGLGAAGTLVLVLGARRFNVAGFVGVLLNTARATSMLLLLVVMAAYLGRLFAFLGVGPALINAVTSLGWPPLAVVFLVCGILFLMGMLFDSAAIILVVGPLAHSMMVTLGVDPIWWGVLFVISMEIALISPPFGINLFVLRGIAKIPMQAIYRGAWVFTAIHVAGLLICILFPSFVLWLPSRM